MSDVFVSYSRRDSEFVKRLAGDLRDHGKDVWVDIEGIRDGERFPDALRRAIAGSDAFVFVISPDSVSSDYCGQEIQHAVSLNKRIVPLSLRAVAEDELPDDIRFRNWIPVGDGGETAVERVIGAIETDLQWEREHTELTVRALHWDAGARERSMLLRGAELAAAERWLTAGADKQPGPTALEQEYVFAGRAGATRRQRTLMSAAGAVAVVAVALLIFALVSRTQAVGAETAARAQALAEAADANLAGDPQTSLALAVRAVREQALPQSLYALREALDGSALLGTYGAKDECSSPAAVNNTMAIYRPVGDQLAVVLCNGVVRLRNGTTGAIELQRRVAGSPYDAISYSPNGSLLAVGERNAVLVVNASSLRPLARFAVHGYAIPAFASSGHSLLVQVNPSEQEDSAPGSLWTFDLRDRSERRLVGEPVFAAAYLAGARQVLVATGSNPTLQVIDAGTGRVLRRLHPGGDAFGLGYPLPLAVSPDGRYFAVGVATQQGDGEVQLWSTAGWRLVRVVADLPGIAIGAVAFSPDSSRLAIGSVSGSGGVWLVSTDQQIVSFSGNTTGVSTLAFSPRAGGDVATTDQVGTVRVWRAHGPEYFDAPDMLDPAGQVGGLVDTGRAVYALGTIRGRDGAVHGWSIPSGQRLASFTLPRGSDPTIYNSPTGQFGAQLSEDGRVVLVSTGSGRHRRLALLSLASHRHIAALPVVPYGYATFASGDRRLMLFDGKPSAGGAYLPAVELTAGDPDPVALQLRRGGAFAWANYVVNAAYSPDGRYLVAADGDDNVDVWAAATGRLVREFTDPGSISSVAVDGADSRIAIASYDGETTIWTLQTGRRVETLVGDAGGVIDDAFTPDGRYVVTSSLDGTVRVWDAASGALLRTYALPAAPFGLAMAPDGSSMAVSDLDGTIRVFNICSDCQNANGLLSLAQRRGHIRLTAAEQAAVDGA